MHTLPYLSSAISIAPGETQMPFLCMNIHNHLKNKKTFKLTPSLISLGITSGVGGWERWTHLLFPDLQKPVT
jgi:hypothetical protein